MSFPNGSCHSRPLTHQIISWSLPDTSVSEEDAVVEGKVGISFAAEVASFIPECPSRDLLKTFFFIRDLRKNPDNISDLKKYVIYWMQKSPFILV